MPLTHFKRLFIVCSRVWLTKLECFDNCSLYVLVGWLVDLKVIFIAINIKLAVDGELVCETHDGWLQT